MVCLRVSYWELSLLITLITDDPHEFSLSIVDASPEILLAAASILQIYRRRDNIGRHCCLHLSVLLRHLLDGGSSLFRNPLNLLPKVYRSNNLRSLRSTPFLYRSAGRSVPMKFISPIHQSSFPSIVYRYCEAILLSIVAFGDRGFP